MRIEGIGDSNGSGFPNRALEQARAFRLAIRPAASTAPAEAARSESVATFAIKDVHDSPPPADRGTEVIASAAAAMQAASTVPGASSTTDPYFKDTDGDGWIDAYSLPYDYFQIVRRTNIKLRTEPIEMPQVAGAAPGVAAAGASATAVAPATGRLSAAMVASMDAI
jgi:hypothetical protein